MTISLMYALEKSYLLQLVSMHILNDTALIAIVTASGVIDDN